MDLGLSGRTYVVTGGSSGIGKALVAMLVDEGACVATCARNVDRLAAETARIAETAADRLLTLGCDVRSGEDTEEFIAAVAERFGGIDGLVSNAGESRMKPFADTTWEDWHDELELKFASVLNPLTAALAHLRRSDAAAVVNVNAILARQPETRLVATSAARAGVLNLSKNLATELAADGIRVNSVCLGLIDSGQWRRRYEAAGPAGSFEAWSAAVAADRGVPLGRFGTPIEVAYVITSLLSPLASFVTGSSLDVGGGVGRCV
ncbi:MAG: SDR family oxidoreductase [Nocardioidaceae bacterium]|nr:SDR family oxidoreductase [Nocardioidaceae bacterium]